MYSRGICLTVAKNWVASSAQLPDSVTVARQILILFVGVQIPVGQPFHFQLFAFTQNLNRFFVGDGFVKIVIAHHHRAGTAAGKAFGKLDTELAIFSRL